jgi:patatin-like phospholipase/acyl hydrolase
MASVAADPTVFQPYNYTTPFGLHEHQVDGSTSAYNPALYGFLQNLGLSNKFGSTSSTT